MPVPQSIVDAARADALLMVPTLSSLVGGLFDIIVDRAACLVNFGTWGKKTRSAVALLIAHIGQLQIEAGGGGGGTSAAGPAASVSMGKLSVSFAGPASSADDAWYSSTSWGQQYLAMRRSLIIAPLTGRLC